MRKIIAGINMTLDGICDHTAIVPDTALHNHYTELLRSADAVLYGRVSYQLMEFWKTIVEQPTGEQSMDDFATVMDKIPKLVFSNSLKTVEWHSAKLAQRDLEKEVLELKQQPGNDIVVGSISLIQQLLTSHLIDEFQLCIHPVIAGTGQSLFGNLKDKMAFQLMKTKTLPSGAIVLYYQPAVV